MDKRFTFKDFVQLVLMVVLIIVVILAMKQFDRQLVVMQLVADDLKEQTAEISQLRRSVQAGIRVAATTGPSTGSAGVESAGAGGVGNEEVFKYVRAAQQKPDYALGDWYVDGFPVKVPVLTPYIAQDLYSTYVTSRVCEWLLTYDAATLDYVPVLAESWTQSEDGLTVTFKLRRGVTFSDGHPFTADDVVFTYNWVMDPKVAAPRVRSTLDKVKGVEKKGDYEVAFYFTEPFFDAIGTVGSLDIIPKHFVSKFTQEQYNTTPGLMMGTGPYRLKDPAAWRPGDLIELVRNERYWGEPGPWEKMIWHEVANETAMETMFKNKEIDAFGTTPEQYHMLVQDSVLMKWARNLEYTAPTSGYNYVAWNQKKKGGGTSHFADKRVRQAMTMLVDRQRFVNEIWYGHGDVAIGPFSPLSGQLDPSIKPLPFDPAAARKLLLEAGYDDRNGDGVIESAGGEPFKFSLVYSSGGAIGERIALFLKDSYARAGIVLTPDPQDWSIMMKKMNERDFDAITLAWSTSVESDIFQMFHSSQIADQGDNFMGYVNPELDKMIEQARTTIDKAKRMPLWHRAHQIIHEDQPYTFLVERRSLGFQDKRIQNVDRSKLGLNYNNRFVLPIPWYVPKASQKWK